MAAPTPARRSLDGYVAQRFPIDFGGHGHWLLTSLDEDGIVTIQAFSDEAVAGWAPLHDEQPDDVTVASAIAHERAAWGEDDAEVWIPPRTDCMEHRPDKPCPHCGGPLFHHRTRRCGDCGRRP